jgi:hypothetical protein
MIAGDAGLAIQTLSARIRELLEILWADPEFWELVNFGPPTFSAADIINVGSFAARIKARSDRVSEYLNSLLTSTERELLLKYTGGPDFTLQQFLADKLNQVIQTGPLYEKKQFSGVKLSPGTLDLIARNPVGAALSLLNVCLLKDAYPSDLYQTASPDQIAWTAMTWYGMKFPKFSAKVWKDFGRDAAAHERLVAVLSQQHWRLEPEKAMPSPFMDKLPRIFRQYLRYGTLDLKNLLTTQVFSKEHMGLICDFACNLKADAEWCLQNFGQVAPLAMRRGAGHPVDVHVARRREQMLRMFKQDHEATQWSVAERCTDKTVAFRALREEARKAALLLKLREGISVKRHVDAAGRGQKPPPNSGRGKK